MRWPSDQLWQLLLTEFSRHLLEAQTPLVMFGRGRPYLGVCVCACDNDTNIYIYIYMIKICIHIFSPAGGKPR